MDDQKTQRGLPQVDDEAADSKTPAFGLRKLNPLRDKLDGKPPDDFGPVRVRKKSADVPALEEVEPESVIPDYHEPENTQRLALSGETMRLSLERAARIAGGVPEPGEISVVWGGRTPLPPPRPPGAPLSRAGRLALALVLGAFLGFTGLAAAKLSQRPAAVGVR